MSEGVFVSYRRSDCEMATGRMCAVLRPRMSGTAGLFLDTYNIRPGDDYRVVIKHSLEQCDVVLVVIGPNWLKADGPEGQRRLDMPDDVHRMEIEFALGSGAAVIPVLVEGAQFPAGSDLPEGLKDLAFRNAWRLNNSRFERDVEDLAGHIRKIRAERRRAQAPVASPKRPVEVIDRPSPWNVSVEVSPSICYALAHNRTPIIHSLRITGEFPPPSRRLTVRVSSAWARDGRPPVPEFTLSIEAPEVGKTVELSPVGEAQLDHIALSELESTVPAEIEVEVSDDHGNVHRSRHEVQIYARNQWLSHPRFIDITAAFVQPNHPDVAGILSAAARRMERRGEAPAMSGYQHLDENPNRVMEISRAIYDELSSRIDMYITPPAPLEDLGQQVRPLDEVLATRQGTCIDLACAYASCVAAAGLYPVIVMVKGHAFPGVLTHEEHLNRSYINTWPEIQSLLDSKMFFGLESTLMPNDGSFDAAMAAVQHRYLEGEVYGVLDVVKAHRQGVRPLPAQVRRGDELIIVVDNGPAEPAVIERRDPTTRRLLPNSVPARVQSWKNSLLDLSFRNRLLNLKTDRVGIRLLPPLGKLGHIEDLLANGDPLLVFPSDELNAVQLNSIPQGKERVAQNLADEVWQEALRQRVLFSTLQTTPFRTRSMRLRSDGRVAEEESGANNLYLTLGSVKWGDSYGTYYSPVFLVPLRIKIGRGDRVLTIAMDETQSTVPNYCLIEALRAREQLTLSWFGDDMTDESGLDVEGGLEVLRREFRDRGLDIRGFQVEQSAALTLLDFKKFRLWRDMNDHWQDFAKRPVVHHLIETPRMTFKDPAAEVTPTITVDDTSLLTPQPADGSQLRAVARSLAGHSFVLEGPPGTGKSQTITNLLANAMHQGKKVLFVAEKQAALGVVYERLEQVGLGPFCLQLHDRGTKPEELRKQLRDAVEHNPSLDERAYAQLEEDFAAAARQLDQYRMAIHSPNDAGYSFFSAHERLMQVGIGPIADIPRQFLQIGDGTEFSVRTSLRELPQVAEPAQPRPNHPWALAGSADFAAVDRAVLTQEARAAIAAASALAGVGDRAGALLNSVSDHLELAGAAALLQLVETGGVPSPADWSQIGSESWNGALDSAVSGLRVALETLHGAVPGNEQVARRTDLAAIAAETATAAAGFVFGRKGRVRTALRDLAGLAGPDSGIVEQGPRLAKALSEVASTLANQHGVLRSLAGMGALSPEVPVTAGELTLIEQRVSLLRRAAPVVRSTGADGSAARDLLGAGGFPVPGTADKAAALATSLHTLVELLGGGTESVRRWASGSTLPAQVAQSAEAWERDLSSGTYLQLQRWLGLQNELAKMRALGLEDFCNEISSGVVVADDAVAAFERGVLTTTMRVRAEEKNLDVFDRVQHDRRVAKFIELLDKRRELAKSAIPFSLARGRKVQSGVAVGRVGEFRAEVARPPRGRGKSVRTLITRYPEIVSDLVPCFLMSPDSVAQFVPPGTIEFDIAVFDEASQVMVADAIGVLGRAKSVVIVGDSRQMPPTRFGVAGSGNGEEEVVEDIDQLPVEEESILDEALQAGFDQEWLSWHYRSQDESLIDFSNNNYYDSKLATFPSPAQSRQDCGIFYRRVDGQFDHGGSRTNAIEAAAVVEEIVRRLDDPATAGLTFGVITLNIQQRHLVEGLLDAHEHPKIRELREIEDPERRLFVLNLENVQGRERDVIVMGTSFSKRANGTAMPLNFGPLTQKGGEKRLNVAITRARRQFVVVSSFDPSEMKDPTSLGMIHLRDYLARAQQRAHGTVDERTFPDGGVSDLLRHLAERLAAAGLRVQVKRGMSNFKVDLALSLPEVPDRWLVAVLLDGREWNERPLVSDRDALPTVILRNMMGWPRVARLWLPSWILEPDQVVADLVEVTRAAAQDPPPAPPPPIAPPGPGAPGPAAGGGGDTGGATPAAIAEGSTPEQPAPQESPAVAAAAGLEGEEPWIRHADPTGLGSAEELGPYHLGAGALARSIVAVEGPVRADLVIKRVANAFGLLRVRDARVHELRPLLSGIEISELGVGEYCWPSSRSPQTWRGFRLSPNTDRAIAEIAPEEIINLMECITRVGFGIERTRLIEETASRFGNRRLTANIREHLDEVVDLAIEHGRLVESGGALSIP